MVCGTKLIDVSQKKYDKKTKQWISRKTKSPYHSAMCPTCEPTKGGVGLAVGQLMSTEQMFKHIGLV